MTRRTRRTFFFGFGGILLLLVAAWVVAVFYFDAIVTGILEKKLIAAVHERSRGAFELSFRSFHFNKGTVNCTGFELSRAGYRGAPSGVGPWHISIDSVRLEGISWVELLLSRPIHLSNLVTTRPTVYLCDLAETKKVFRNLGPDTGASSGTNITVLLVNASLPDIRIFQSSPMVSRDVGTVWLALGGVHYSSNSHSSGLPFTLEHLDLSAPHLDYRDSAFAIRAERCLARSEDSSISIGALAIRNGSSFEVNNIHGTGMNFEWAMRGNGIAMRELSGNDWNAAYSPKMPVSDSLNKKIVPFPIAISHVALSNGTIKTTGTSSANAEHISIHAADVRLDSNQLFSREISTAAAHFDYHAKNESIIGTTIQAKGTNVRLDSGFSGSGEVSASSFSMEIKNWNVRTINAQAAVANIRIDSEISGSIDATVSSGWFHNQTSNIIFKSAAANSSDSSFSIASLDYKPSAADGGHVTGIRATGIDYEKLSSAKQLAMQSLSVRGWSLDYDAPASSGDSGNGKSLAQKQASMAKSISLPISIRHIALPNGNLHFRSETSTLDATHANIEASGFAIDPNQRKKTPLFSRDVRARAASVLYTMQNGSDTIFAQNFAGSTGRGTIASDTLQCSFIGKEGPMVRTRFHFGAPKLTGIAFDSLWENTSISLGSVSARAWSIYRMKNIPEAEEERPGTTTTHSNALSNFQLSLPIEIGKIELPNGRIHFRERDTETLTTSNDMLIEASDFRIRPSSANGTPVISTEQLISSLTSFRYSSPGSYYALRLHNFHGNLRDSLITMDSLGYIPNYSEAEWTRVHKYSVGRAHFFLSNVKLSGIDCGPTLGNYLHIQTFEAPTFELRYYKDERPPSDPHPDTVWLPNDFIRTTKIPFTIERIALDSGDIQIRMRSNPDTTLASMQFDHASMTASPLSTDPNDPASREPTSIDARGIYLGVSPVEIKAVYPLHDSGFDFSATATVGPFDAKRLNDFLIHEDQKKITSGSFENGEIKVSVTNGTGTTTVIPEYQNLHIKILSTKPGKRPDIKENAETFVANEFIVHHNNPRSVAKEPVSATISETRKYADEFFGFLWDMIERALGKVIGGFQ